MPSTYTLISSNVLSSTASSVTFSAIPSTYTDLALRVSARTNYGAISDYLQIYFNGSTAANYSDTTLWGDGASVFTLRNSNANLSEASTMSANNATANTFGSAEIYIPNYTASQNKPVGAFGVAESNTTSFSSSFGVVADASLWRDTTAITSITLDAYGTYQIGSSFYLYGISKS
jgi:hypothetical protein